MSRRSELLADAAPQHGSVWTYQVSMVFLGFEFDGRPTHAGQIAQTGEPPAGSNEATVRRRHCDGRPLTSVDITAHDPGLVTGAFDSTIRGLRVKLTFESTAHSDAETLVRMRIAAMRESLERIGRFDPQRARDRFISSFDPSLCKFILIDGVSVGFVVVRRAENHLALDHLYVVPEHQGKGIGSSVLGSILQDADTQLLTVKLGALRDSDSNRFYQRHGFVKEGEAEWDIYYARTPVPRQRSDHA